MRQWTRITAVGIAALPVLGNAVAPEEPRYVEVTKLLASDGGFGDHFGDTLAIDGDTLLVGGDDIGPGGAYVFERNEGGSNAWREVVKLLAPDMADNFGRSVELQGDVVAVGATDDKATGSVYFFERDKGGPGNWGLVSKLQSPEGPVEGQHFARPALDGEILLVGASADDEGGGFGAGAVFVFEHDQTVPERWSFVQKVLASDSMVNAKFGVALDIDEETFIVGAINHEVAGQDHAGAAYVFELEDGRWVETSKLTAELPETDGNFGEAVAIEGDTVAVGHPGEGSNEGAVYVYGRDVGGSGHWGLDARLIASDRDSGDSLGVAVDLDGGRLVAGAELSDDVTAAGAVYVFEKSSALGWIELARLEATDLAESQHFGTAVGISGGTLLAGADQDDQSGSSAGAAYVFQVVSSPRIDITGACPGEVTLELSGATSWGSVVVAHATSEGMTVVPGGECGQVELDLEDADLLARFLAGEDGSKSLVRTVPAGACGRLLQAVDGVTCGVGPVGAVP